MYTNVAEVVAQMKTGNYEIDERRTTELKQPELLVVSDRGDVDHFCCILVPSKARPGCPRCGNPLIRNQGNLHRDFLDVIRRGDDAAVVTISLEFRKSKCVAVDCGRVYYPEYSFARYLSQTAKISMLICPPRQTHPSLTRAGTFSQAPLPSSVH